MIVEQQWRKALTGPLPRANQIKWLEIQDRRNKRRLERVRKTRNQQSLTPKRGQ